MPPLALDLAAARSASASGKERIATILAAGRRASCVDELRGDDRDGPAGLFPVPDFPDCAPLRDGPALPWCSSLAAGSDADADDDDDDIGPATEADEAEATARAEDEWPATRKSARACEALERISAGLGLFYERSKTLTEKRERERFIDRLAQPNKREQRLTTLAASWQRVFSIFFFPFSL